VTGRGVRIIAFAALPILLLGFLAGWAGHGQEEGCGMEGYGYDELVNAASAQYRLGRVRPQTANAANVLGSSFSIKTITGNRDADDGGARPAGLDLDFMVDDIPDGMEVGERLAEHLVNHADELGVAEVTWRQRVWSADRGAEGWRPVEDHGSLADRLHLSLADAQPTSGAQCLTIPGVVNEQGWAAPAAGGFFEGYGAPQGSPDEFSLPSRHQGVDLAHPYCGAPLWAVHDGRVSFVGFDAAGAGTIVVAHDNGVESMYVHMPESGMFVREGERVVAGQQIGKAGTWGLSDIGCHLHFEMAVDGSIWTLRTGHVDPAAFLADVGIDLGEPGFS